MMITLENLQEDNYFLPEDGEMARKRFLELLSMPGECWVSAYGFNMPDMFDIIKKNDASGYPYHLLLDYMQSQGPSAKPLLKDLNHNIKNSDITLTTAGINSKKTSQIWHWKGLVKHVEDGEPWCWEGSVNFSDSGWYQGNSARVFRSQIWADEFIKQNQIHKQWAIETHAQYQATIMEAGFDPIDVYFDQVAPKENEYAIEAINNIKPLMPEYADVIDKIIAKLRNE